MKRITLLLLFLILLSGQALTAPIILKSSVNPDGYTVPILIYSDSRLKVYVPEDMVTFNLFWSKYPQNGNFNFRVYIEPVSKKLHEEYTAMVKRHIANGTARTIGASYPDLFEYVASDMYFDIENRQVIITQEIFIDRDGDVIAFRDKFREINSLDNPEYPGFKKIAEAASRLLENTKNDPKTADYLRYLGQTPQTKEAIARSQTDQYYDILKRGIQAIKEKQYDKAIEHLNEAIALDPNNYKAYGWMGEVKRLQNDFHAAIEYCSKAISLNDRHPDNYENRGIIYLENKQYSLALADFTRALELSPNPTPSLYLRKALTHELLNQKQQAVDAYFIFLENNHGKGQLSDKIVEHARDYIKNNR